MQKLLASAATLALGTSIAQAGGLDRTYLPVGIIFEEGNYAEFSLSRTDLNLFGDGVGIAPVLPAGSAYRDVGAAFTASSFGLKMDVEDNLSFSLVYDQPYGADVAYNAPAASTELGGTSAFAETRMLTGLVRYKYDENWSAYGGLRINQAQGDITLNGIAYSVLGGYNVALGSDTAVGYVLGAAYEMPEIALRVALTYNSSITHDFATTEDFSTAAAGGALPATVIPSQTEVELPQSVALDFQSGVAPNTLVFGQIRWSEWSAFQLNPQVFTGNFVPTGLISLDDYVTYTLGVGYRFNEKFSGSITWVHEAEGDPLVSPLAPGNGFDAVSIGGRYTAGNGVEISGGIRYTAIGASTPETGTPDVARASFDNNSAVSLGMKIAYRF